MKFHISQNTPVVIITNAVKGNSNCEKHLDEILIITRILLKTVFETFVETL